MNNDNQTLTSPVLMTDDQTGLQVDNNSTIVVGDSTNPVGVVIISQGSTGTQGSQDDRDGGASFQVELTNNADVTFTLSQAEANQMAIGVRAASRGGAGLPTQPEDDDEGGSGGASNSVKLTNNAAVTLQGINANFGSGATGVSVESAGGTGGPPESHAIDHYGGNGGNAGIATLINNATVSLGTSAAPLVGTTRMWGVAAESLGGFTGNYAKGQITDGTPAGQAGSASNVTLTNLGNVAVYWAPVAGSSTSDGLAGIIARSVGGAGGFSDYSDDAGGNGGNAGPVQINVGPALGAPSSGQTTVIASSTLGVGGISAGVVGLSRGGVGGTQQSHGSSGGAGGSAGAVDIQLNAATVTTFGDSVAGVVAFSRGANGGEGDATDHTTSGGNGGNAGDVSIALDYANNSAVQISSVSTQGTLAYGLLAQSVGGFGGTGTSQGGIGQNAGSAWATIQPLSSVTTVGDYAAGIVTQSIGGGGGTGTDFTDGLAGVGGNGGNGGDGINATISAAGTVRTTGQHAYGLLAQSIGGSGGTGGIGAGLVVALGGDGGSGGGGGTVQVTNSGNVTTNGYGSTGMIGQSIGGGGGAAGSAVGLIAIGGSVTNSVNNSGGAVTLNNTGTVATVGNAATSLLGQSVGGGGGSAASTAGLLSIGGRAGSAGSGSAVTVHADGVQTTSGNYAYGAAAQSIGGGGGNGGDAFAVTTAAPIPTIGGAGGNGGSGGAITLTVNNDGRVSTSGDGATGVLAQSIGGGGGSGGSAVQLGVLDTVSLAIGGAGGVGGSASTVNIQTSGATLSTNGASAVGMLAQSIGGGGGSGGAAQATDVNIGFSLGLAIGGSGGAGGHADQVSLTLANTQINTAGLIAGQVPAGASTATVDQTDSFGILAQSIGGGGGHGGSAAGRSIALEAPIPDGTSFAIGTALAIGGSGGFGGTGAEVDVTLSGNSAIQTNGQGSHGVLAQSVGGGGGSGGDSKAMSRTVTIEDTSVAVNVDVAVGGSGGATGSAALVNMQLNDSAQITTYGDYSNALMGQSLGGGGGNAGVGSSGTGGVSQGSSYTVNVGVGGKGSGGGNGGAVQATLASASQITTVGSGSRGVLLQSIGGGGGASQGTTVDLGIPFSSGGDSDSTTSMSASVSVSVGEVGGVGGDGGLATLTHNGTINTAGNDADGALLQSIGGGGGLGGSAGSDASAGPVTYPSGGDNPDAPPAPSDDTNLGSYSLSVGVGGAGGSGGDGGLATLIFSGMTTTQGDLADAMVVQSIGGGGGVGGTAAAKGARGDGAIQVAVGGSGGIGGDGNTINLNMFGQVDPAGKVLTGQLTTYGNVAYGLLAQSIGGGGGQGADGSADLTYKTVTTPSLLVGVNGTGGNGGKGGAITLNAANSLFVSATYGTASHAVVLQSIGGGGGVGSIGSSASIQGVGLALQLGGGGSGLASGGGDITVSTALLTNTQGDGAYGLVAQSIGGGGGIANAGAAANISSATIDNTGQNNSNDASGNTVDVTLNTVSSLTPGAAPMESFYDIQSRGSAAHGIVLQSVGGGGGIAGDPSASSLQMGWLGGGQARPDATTANGGDVSLNMSNVYMRLAGDNSIGVIMQSIADGGGLGGTTQGNFAGSVYDHSNGGGSKAGSVTFSQDSSGKLLVYGANPIGIFAQSVGNISDASPISVTINGVVETTTSDPNGIGVWLDGGSTANTVNIGGTLSSTVATRQTGNGVLTVNNSGTVGGSHFLSAENSEGVGVLNNTGTVLNAATIKGSVFNEGTVRIGERAKTDRMHVTNDLSQGDAGTLHVDADFSGMRGDMLTVDGAARLGGRVQIDALTLMPNRELTFLQAGSLAPNASVGGASNLFDFDTRYSGQSAAVSVGQANFNRLSDSYGVGGNLSEVGQHLQHIWDRGSNEALGTLYAQLDGAAAGGKSGYSSALSDLSPGPLAAPAALATAAMRGFAGSLFSCPRFAADQLQATEGDCSWGRVAATSTRLDAGRGTSSTKSRSVSYQLGAQRKIAPNWVFGVSGAYENTTIRSDDDRTRTKGDVGYLGAVLKYETGPWTFSGATYGSRGSYDNHRSIKLTGDQAESDSKVWSIGQQLRGSYTYATETAYIKPYTNLDLIYTRSPSYSERGAGAMNLNVKSADQITALLTPGVEVGGRIDLNNGLKAHPYVNVGVSIASTDKWDSRAQLAVAPAGSPDFRTTLDTGRVFGQASVGVQLTSNKGMDVRLQYDAVGFNRAHSSGGSVKASWLF